MVELSSTSFHFRATSSKFMALHLGFFSGLLAFFVTQYQGFWHDFSCHKSDVDSMAFFSNTFLINVSSQFGYKRKAKKTFVKMATVSQFSKGWSFMRDNCFIGMCVYAFYDIITIILITSSVFKILIEKGEPFQETEAVFFTQNKHLFVVDINT